MLEGGSDEMRWNSGGEGGLMVLVGGIGCGMLDGWAERTGGEGEMVDGGWCVCRWKGWLWVEKRGGGVD